MKEADVYDEDIECALGIILEKIPILYEPDCRRLLLNGWMIVIGGRCW